MKFPIKLDKFKSSKILAGALGLLLALTLVVTLIAPVSAVPQPGHRFWGTAYTDDALAPEGTEVVAKIAGVAEEFTTVVDANHHYGYDPAFYVKGDDPDKPGKEGGTTGDTIEFYVAGTLTITFPFEIGGSDELDLVGAPPPEYTITFDTDPAATGSITFDGESYSDGETVNKTAATYDIVAGPAANYTFSTWKTTGDLLVAAPSSATTTCNVSGAGTLKMVQTTAPPPPEYTITFATDPAATGSITFDGESYSDGETVNKTAATYNIVAGPAANYTFKSWVVTTGDLLVAAPSSATTTCNVSGAGTLKMVQTTAPVTYNLTISSTSGGNVTTPGEGTFTYNASEVVDLVASPDTDYQFGNWTGDVGTIDNVTSASTNITMSGNYSITANFEETYYTLTVNVKPSGSGTVTLSPSQPATGYEAGTSVTLTAYDATGDYEFDHWSGDLSGDTSPATIAMNDNYSIIANFKWVVPCFIATAAYGTPAAEEIDILREFRDEVMLPNRVGAELVSLYYRFSPPVADFISRHEVLRTIVREAIVKPLVMIVRCSQSLWD